MTIAALAQVQARRLSGEELRAGRGARRGARSPAGAGCGRRRRGSPGHGRRGAAGRRAAGIGRGGARAPGRRGSRHRPGNGCGRRHRVRASCGRPGGRRCGVARGERGPHGAACASWAVPHLSRVTARSRRRPPQAPPSRPRARPCRPPSAQRPERRLPLRPRPARRPPAPTRPVAAAAATGGLPRTRTSDGRDTGSWRRGAPAAPGARPARRRGHRGDGRGGRRAGVERRLGRRAGAGHDPRVRGARTPPAAARGESDGTHVVVLNSTETDGLAHHLSASLRQSGYALAPRSRPARRAPAPASVVEYAAGHRGEAENVARARHRNGQRDAYGMRRIVDAAARWGAAGSGDRRGADEAAAVDRRARPAMAVQAASSTSPPARASRASGASRTCSTGGSRSPRWRA